MREKFVNQVLAIRRSMAFKDYLLAFFLVIIATTTHVTADLIQGCGGFVEVELRTLDGLVKDRTRCAPMSVIPSKASKAVNQAGDGLSLGKYKKRASRPDLNVEVRGSVEVELGFGNVLVDDIFFVPGYEIRGSVVAQGSGNAPGQRTALCHAISDAEGMFTFKSIHCGVYELIPYYKGENTVFDVSPPSMSVSVEHDHATVAPKFQVTGFSVGGRVVDGNGVGVDGVTSSRYTIEAKEEHYKFDRLKDFMVLPNMASVADIKAVSYDLCGIVLMVSSGYKAKIALTHVPENVKPQVKQTDEGGNFCFEVPPGEYRLSALAAKPDIAPGLLFLPPHVDVLVNSPVLNVEFHQAQVNVLGAVTCKEKCGSSVFVTLASLGAKISIDFNFIVKHTSLEEVSGEDQWCWEQRFIDVAVGMEDIKGIAFVHKGYRVNVISTHDVDAHMTQPDGSHVDLKLKVISVH
ncbi:carbohydrate-binding-like fold [Actinidia rufa]|uniref:Carbohydrate-binding-like fold n=1 Tax=Actinidia rufa TaxID=165716 RepID=A0A7J0GSL3_9ERIC|nr:carbohydrate-binding-like fold [Actinidia rufa]